LKTLHHGRSASELVETSFVAPRKPVGAFTTGRLKFGPTAHPASESAVVNRMTFLKFEVRMA
jgi:hypothetical protein